MESVLGWLIFAVVVGMVASSRGRFERKHCERI